MYKRKPREKKDIEAEKREAIAAWIPRTKLGKEIRSQRGIKLMYSKQKRNNNFILSYQSSTLLNSTN